jgi:hypothetical protein
MLAEQGGECLGCRARPTVTGRKLYVDHDHACCPGPESCGECVRGLLCMVCNWVVGRVRDDAQTMERLASYLRAHVRT